jgi:hypothetical protein
MTDARRWIVIGTRTPFTSERAPCGKQVSGTRYFEDDGSGIRCDDAKYDCGCQSISHQFHDGSTRTRVTRHDGKLLVNELSAEHAE